MDFSFVEPEGGLKRKESGSSGHRKGPAPSSSAGAPGTGQRIAIPSFNEVQRAEQHPKAALASNFVRPLTRNSSQTDALSGSSLQLRPGANAFAFLDSGPGSRPRLAGSAAQVGTLPQAPLHQQHQQQQPGRFLHGTYIPAFPEAVTAATPGLHPSSGSQPDGPAAAQYPPAHPSQPNSAHLAQHPAPMHRASQLQPPPPQQQGNQPQPFPPNAIIVNRRQEGNPVLKYIRNVRWQFGDIVPDYMIGKDAAALFISLRYHLLKPDYIHQRIRELQRSFRLRLVLCHVDTEDAVEPLAQVTRAAIGNECTLFCAWSNQECARYLETFKSYENKPAEVIQKDVGSDYVSRINAALTTIRYVNKTDVKTLGDRFGSVSAIFKASLEELQRCPGIGPTKAKRLIDTFQQPFRKTINGGGLAGPPGSQHPQQSMPEVQPALPSPKPLQQAQQVEWEGSQSHSGARSSQQAADDSEQVHAVATGAGVSDERSGDGEDFDCAIEDEEDWDV